jgi:predicted AAA+ superfamily ATPase
MNQQLSFYQRPVARVLETRLLETPRRLQIVAGPRQVGKTTLVQQVLSARPAASCYFVAADNPNQSGTSAYDSLSMQLAAADGGIPPGAGWVQ